MILSQTDFRFIYRGKETKIQARVQLILGGIQILYKNMCEKGKIPRKKQFLEC